MQCSRWPASGGEPVSDGQSSDRRSPIGGGLEMWHFLNLPIKMVHSGVLFIPLCRVKWLDVKELNTEMEVNKLDGAHPHPLSLTMSP